MAGGFATMNFLGQDWYLVRRDHSIEGGWHPANDNLAGTETYGGFTFDVNAQQTFSVPFGDAADEFLLASGDMSMWVTIKRSEVAAQCAASCANCKMELTASSNGDISSPLQYCRTGSGEDPWISAGDHPDLIVYGENSWASHHIGQDGSEDALQRGGSNVWINCLPTGCGAPAGGTSTVIDTRPVADVACAGTVVAAVDNAYTLYLNEIPMVSTNRLVGNDNVNNCDAAPSNKAGDLWSGCNWQSVDKYTFSGLSSPMVVAIDGLDAGGVGALIASATVNGKVYPTTTDWKCFNGGGGVGTGSFVSGPPWGG
jgi:hypothetical protein